MNARTLAINCTAKLYAFRKTRDGVIAQFVIHPNEVPEKLQTDPIGTSYLMALVEIDDATGQPKGGATENSSAEQPRPSPPAGGAKSYAQEAGRLCNDVRFQAFLARRLGLSAIPNADRAAEEVRWFCSVDTRADIVAGTYAGRQWEQLAAEYAVETA